jgi:hypothetical protein
MPGDSAASNRPGLDFAARRTRRAYGNRHASLVAVLRWAACAVDTNATVALFEDPDPPPLPLIVPGVR